MIRTQNLTKDFLVSRSETVHAVKSVNLTVEPGELVAVLGPNGAGKTTAMRMLTS
jgi:ABC-2 type transport system ATP-binding protein